ncbi:MAG: methylglyoxal synthase [Bacteroidota bacterium]
MKNIVVMAHNEKKAKLASFLKERERWLWGRKLIATGRSAEFLEKEKFKLPIIHLSPGKSGGYNQITDLVKAKDVDMVIFFQDIEVKEHHDDIRQLLDACNTANIPLATNPATADLLIIGIIRKQYSQRKSLEI